MKNGLLCHSFFLQPPFSAFFCSFIHTSSLPSCPRAIPDRHTSARLPAFDLSLSYVHGQTAHHKISIFRKCPFCVLGVLFFCISPLAPSRCLLLRRLSICLMPCSIRIHALVAAYTLPFVVDRPPDILPPNFCYPLRLSPHPFLFFSW